MDLKEKVVLITGSSQGIGRETAIEFAQAGAKVIVTYNTNKEEGRKTLEACKKYSPSILLKLDVTSEKSISSCLKEIEEKFQKLDVLINNSGIYIKKPFKEQTLEELEKQIEVNLLGTIKTTKLALSFLEKSLESIIINISSMAGKYPHKNQTAYGASKFGVRGFTQALSYELPEKIKTYCINPNLTSTKMTNFHGVDPRIVSKTVLKVASEDLNMKSGEEIDLN